VTGTLTTLLHAGDFAIYESLASAVFSLMSDVDSVTVAEAILLSITDARHYPPTILPNLQVYARHVFDITFIAFSCM